MSRDDYQCIVVGAGPAGLAAGEVLHTAGVEFAIVEAGGEIGGRAKSVTLPEGAVFERGAMVLHGLRVMTWEAAIRHGLTTHGSYLHEWFPSHSAVDNEWAAEPETDDFQVRLEQLGAVLLDPASEDRSLFDIVEHFAADADEREQLLEHFTDLVPLDPREVDAISAGQILLRESPRTALFELVEGYSELWRRLSAPFARRLLLDSPVTAIRHSPGGVEVSVGSRTLTAPAAIVTPSVGVLQSGAIEFAPELPPEKAEAIAGLRMAPMIKIGARFRRPLWEDAIGDALSFAVPSARHAQSWFALYAQRGRYPILLTLLGTGSEELTGDAETIKAAMRADLEAAFGRATIAEELVEILVEDWPSDPLALGAASVAPVGKRHLRAVLAAPTPPLFWAGEACATDGHAECIEGAIATGRTAAIEALHCVRSFKVRQPGSRLDWGKARE